MKVRKNVYGLSRSRSNDSEGRVTNMAFKPVCNTLHSQVGGARPNMEVYIIEEYEEERE